MLKMKTTRYRQGNKYHAKKAKGWTSGKMYHSSGERDRAEVLKLMEKAGEIEALEEQPKVMMTKYHPYHPDFTYLEKGRRVFEDFKGAETERFKINCNLWRERGPGVLRITRRRGKYGKVLAKEIYPDTYDESMWEK